MKITLIVFIALLLTVGTAVACYVPEVYPPISFEPLPSTEPSQEPNPSDTVVSIEPNVTEEPTSTSSAQESDAPKSDGRSDGLSSCPSCTQTPVIPNSPPSTGRGL